MAIQPLFVMISHQLVTRLYMFIVMLLPKTIVVVGLLWFTGTA